MHGIDRYGNFKDLKFEKCKQFFEATGSWSSRIRPVPKNRKKQKSFGKEIVPNRESGFLCPVPPPGTRGFLSQAQMNTHGQYRHVDTISNYIFGLGPPGKYLRLSPQNPGWWVEGTLSVALDILLEVQNTKCN